MQTFDLADIPRIFFLGFLEWLLSADNAIIIALLIRALPSKQRTKALIIGIASAFLFRAIGIGSISFLIRYFWIELLGAAYLFFIVIRYFFFKTKKDTPKLPQHIHFFKTILLIEVMDLAFALDSIVAGLAFIAPFNLPHQINPKLWIIYVGGMLGLIGVRFAAEFFNRMLDRFPKLEDSAHLMIGWIALELTLDGIMSAYSIDKAQYPLITIVFWVGIVVLFFLGLFTIGPKKRNHE